VNSLEDAREEFDTIYKSKSGRPHDEIAFNLITMGMYRLMNELFPAKKKSQTYRFILDYMNLIGFSNSKDENTLGATIHNMDKHNYTPQWKPKRMGDYRTSPNNPSSEYLW